MYYNHLNHTNHKPKRIGVLGIDDAVIAAVGIALKYLFSWLSDIFGDSKQFKAWKAFLSGKDVLIIDLLFDYRLFMDVVGYMEDNGVYTPEARKGLSFLFYNIQYAFINFPAATTADFQSKYGISFYNYITTGIVPSKDIEPTSYILLRPIYFPGIGYEQPGVPHVNPQILALYPNYPIAYKSITDFRYPDAVWYSRTAYNQKTKMWEPAGETYTTEAAAVNDIAQQIYDFRIKYDPEFAKQQANKAPIVYSDRNTPAIILTTTNRPGTIKAMTQRGAIELLNDTPQALPQKVKQSEVYNAAAVKQTSNPIGWILGISMLGFLITKAD